MNTNMNYPKEYWHCFIMVDKDKSRSVINDLSFDELQKQIIEPWLTNRSFTLNGKVIRNQSSIKEIKIVQTQYSQKQYANQYHASMKNSNFIDLASDRRLLPFSQGNDYTNELLFNTDKISSKNGNLNDDKQMTLNNKIFIVHGRDDLAKIEVARFIEKIELEAIILHEQASSGNTIIEKIEEHTDVGFGIVLYTPCDKGGLANEKEQKLRARQNVIFEHGYLIGKLGREKVCALVKDDVETPNDISGIVYIALDIRGAWKLDIAKELRNAGYKINMDKII